MYSKYVETYNKNKHNQVTQDSFIIDVMNYKLFFA